MSYEVYDNPLIARYASDEMCQLWSPRTKFRTWRKLWTWLAEAESQLGLPVTKQQVAELAANIDDIDFPAAEAYEQKLRHDVMAHVHAYGDKCPTARPIIHLGATSCYVTDNTDLILLRDSLAMVRQRLVGVIEKLAAFAKKNRDLPCLAYTHLQPAQPTTVGKRACLWIYDLVQDLADVDFRIKNLRARGVKGTTGSQASFLELFHGDHAKVRKLDQLVCKSMGFDASYAVTGQTYSRKVDAQIVDALAGIASTAHKAANDLRLLQSFKEIEEPFEKNQIGSSAMAYKRNPMRAERICGLARFVQSLQSSAQTTLATQWMERTLDDSANRRLTLPQAFLAVDAILIIYQNIASGLVVHRAVIETRLKAELPFMATENILMAAVAQGGDRQTLHEKIRQHSQAAATDIIEKGLPNTLLQRLAADSDFKGVELGDVLDASKYVGRAPEQVAEFLAEVVAPILSGSSAKGSDVSLRV